MMLPQERIERVGGWGMAVSGAAYVYRPSNNEGIREVMTTARENDVAITARGAG